MSEHPHFPRATDLTPAAPMTAPGLAAFAFEGAEVRVVTRDGEPWFVAKDVATLLGYANPQKAVRDHCKRAVPVGVNDPFTPTGMDPQTTIFPEADLYRLVMRSKLPSAERFEEWVVSEVLPAIRRTGGYMVAAPEETPEELMLRALRVAQDTVERQKAALAIAEPKAEALDRIAEADGRMAITNAAKVLGVRPKDLFAYLISHGWIYRRPGASGYLGYASKIVTGLLEHKVTTVLRADGTEKVVEQVLVTPKGLTRLATLLPPAGAEVLTKQ